MYRKARLFRFGKDMGGSFSPRKTAVNLADISENLKQLPAGRRVVQRS